MQLLVRRGNVLWSQVATLLERASRRRTWIVGEMWQVFVISDGNSTSDGSTVFKAVHCVHKWMIKEPWLLPVALVISSASSISEWNDERT